MGVVSQLVVADGGEVKGVGGRVAVGVAVERVVAVAVAVRQLW